MGGGPSFALGAPRRPLQGCGGLLRVWINEASVAWAWGPPSLWDHRGHVCESMGACLVLGSLWGAPLEALRWNPPLGTPPITLDGPPYHW